ncbi:MAG: transposase [Clostridia bacterium]|nr:transposase [Clostridia bacterium]
MHPAKFFSEIDFVTAGLGWGNYVNTDEVKERLTNIHPSQLITSRLKIPLFRIRFSYTTPRGNHREHEKYMFTSKHDECHMEAQMNFESWVEDYNREHPHRKMSNVNILDIEYISDARLSIE